MEQGPIPRESGGETRGRGRPPSAQTERAILEATVELLGERGLADLTVEEVASRAHVGKASVYRRWPSKGVLAFDAFMASFLERQPLPNTGSLRGDLTGAMLGWVRTVREPVAGRTLRGMIAEVQRDPGLAAAWRDRFLEPVRARTRQVISRAQERGELASGIEADAFLDLCYGPLYFRLLQTTERPLDNRFVAMIVDTVLAGAQSGALSTRER